MRFGWIWLDLVGFFRHRILNFLGEWVAWHPAWPYAHYLFGLGKIPRLRPPYAQRNGVEP